VETLTAWLPIEGMEEELFLESVRCDLGKLRVTLSKGKGASRVLSIDFGEPQAFRVQPQHVYLNEPWWGSLSAASVYVVENSKYRAWLRDSSVGIFDQEFKHFCVITVADALDVLTLKAPVANWVASSPVSLLPPNTWCMDSSGK
jgi:hypothetical protein